jgi:glyoxylase-like metal-dependent hydrolase (beta-lactamase superfamily II)
MKPQTIGDIVVSKLIEEIHTFDTATGLPDAVPEVIRAHRDWLDPHLYDFAADALLLSFHTYIVRTPRHVILVDTCMGNDKDRPWSDVWHHRSGPYLDQLVAMGVAPEEVDYVMCTHLHSDHVGWNTRLLDGRWVPTFPNARYVFSQRDYDHYRTIDAADHSANAFYDSVLPVVEAGQAVLIGDDFAIDDSVTILPTPGHTPGHYCVRLRSKGAEAILTGDLMHFGIQVARPDWSPVFCTDPVASAAMRSRFVDTYAESGVLMMPAHFPGPTCGHIVRHGDTTRFALKSS